MRRRLRRFVAVGSFVTVVHLLVLVGLAVGVGLAVPLAAVIAVGIAAVVSFVLHRAVTFADDPFASVDHRPRTFTVAVLPAAAVDVTVVSLLTLGVDELTVARLLLAELPALAAAGVVRLVTYRRVLFAAVRAEQRPAAAARRLDGDVALSVVVPVYRDAENIAANLSRLRADLGPHVDGLEIVVVDDGSGDDTPEAAAEGGADVVLVQDRNRGKGAAVRRGVLAARGRSVVFTDADLAYPPEQMRRMVAELEAGADVVVGNRRHPEAELRRGPPRVREMGSLVFNVVTHLVLLGHYRDTQCGLKGFRRDAARLVFSNTTIDRFAFDVEVLHLVERYRLSLVEIPVVLEDHADSTISVLPVAAQMVRDVLRVRRQGSHGVYDLAVPVDEARARIDLGEAVGEPRRGPRRAGGAVDPDPPSTAG